MNALPLPKAIVDDLQAGRRPLTTDAKQRLASLLQAVESPFPDLYAQNGIEGANRLWTSEHVGLYLGRESQEHPPGNIDPHLACIIGQAEPDSPIALDYRVSPPRVLYLGTVGNQSLWIELATSYEHLAAAIAPPTPDSPPSTPCG